MDEENEFEPSSLFFPPPPPLPNPSLSFLSPPPFKTQPFKGYESITYPMLDSVQKFLSTVNSVFLNFVRKGQ